MPLCANCGTNNIEGVRFCVSCGSQIGDAPAPESWRASSELGGSVPPAASADPTADAGGSAGYTPQVPPAPPSYPAYAPQQQQGVPYYQQQPQPASQPMHPAVPAVVSLFFPGLGLLFVPNKAGLGIGIFVAYLIFTVVTVLLVIGICLAPLANVLLAVHSWDEAAKNSRGQFQPILFK